MCIYLKLQWHVMDCSLKRRFATVLRVVDPKASGMAQIAAAICCSTLSEADASMNG